MKPNYREIFEAWVTSYNPTEKEKELAKKRLAICKGCEYKKETIKGMRWSTICDKCGCPLSKKVFSKIYNSCPAKKWESIDSEYITPLDEKDTNSII